MPRYAIYLIIGFGGLLVIAIVSSCYYYFKKKHHPESAAVDTKPTRKQSQDHPPLYFGMYEGFGAKMGPRFDIYVYVIPEPNSCPLCRVFENQVLVLAPQSDRYLTMHEAIAAGYHHLGCTHQEANYYFTKTTLPNGYDQVEQERQYNLRKNLFRYEAAVREQDYLMFHANHVKAQQSAKAQKQVLLQKITAVLPSKCLAISWVCL